MCCLQVAHVNCLVLGNVLVFSGLGRCSMGEDGSETGQALIQGVFGGGWALILLGRWQLWEIFLDILR